MDRQGSSGRTLTKLGLGVLVFNSLLTVYTSWGDASSVAFVLAADAALLLLFLCLRREFEQGGGAGGGEGAGQYCALAKVGLAMLTCETALDAYDTRRDPASAVLVFVSFLVLVMLTGLFVRGFARA